MSSDQFGRAARVCVSAALLLFVGGAAAQSITSVGVFPGGGNSVVYSISSNGTAATGYSNDASGRDTTLRWLSPSTTQNLGLLSGGVTNTYGQAINITGSIIAGYGDSGGNTRAFRWTSTGGYQILPLIPGTSFATGSGLNAGGSRVVGTSGIGSTARAFMWEDSSPGVVLNLGVLAGQSSSGANAISADGTTVVGASGSLAFRWTSGSGMVNLGSLPGQTSAVARGVSADGLTVAGLWSNGGERGFKWTSGTGMVDLPFMPTGTVLRPRGISGDGTLVVGQGTGTIGLGAFVHSDAMGSVDLASHLTARGVNLTGWQLQDCYAVNFNGTAFGGYGFFGGQSVGFVVSGLSCPSVSGSAITLSGCPSDNVSMTSYGPGGATSGTGLVYRWYRNGILITSGTQPGGSVITNANTDPLVIQSLTASDAGSYWCVVSSQGACPVQGPTKTLAVTAAASVTSEPADTSICIGMNAVLSTSGTVPSGTIQYRWQKHVTGFPPNIYADIFDGPTGNGSTFSGTGTPTFTIVGAVAADTERYRCVISNAACPVSTAAVTRRALVTVNGDTTITLHPVATSQCFGDNDASFTVAATPTGQVTYQWMKRQPPFPNVYADIFDGPTGNGGSYGGTQTATLTISGLFAADFDRYRCRVSGPCGVDQVSSNALLSAISSPMVATHPASAVVGQNCTGVLALTLSPGNYGTLSYQWVKVGFGVVSDGPTAWGSLRSGALTPTLSISSFKMQDAGSYYCNVNGSCGFAFTNQATLTYCAADFNCDGGVDFFDYLDFVGAFSSSDASADFNGDTTIDFFDYLDFVGAFSTPC
jgi:uncharacterized membrane protein